MTRLLDSLTGLNPALVYLVVALLVFAEDALLVGFILPGETAAVIGGVTARLGHTNLVAMMVVVVFAAIFGDSVGYLIGRRYGVRVLDLPSLQGFRARSEKARDYLGRRGGPAVFTGRFVAFLRAAMPFLSGVSHMRYRTFLVYNVAGGVAWGVSSVLLGYLAAASYQRVAAKFGEITAIVVGAIALVLLVVWAIRRHRHEH